ncbi:MAG: hypothetical protein ACYC9L_12610 [Sulfuricaulis sp.]
MSLNLKMNLDKKSLIQIVLLIVIVVGGAAFYFVQQSGGGLDSIISFATSFLGSKPVITRAPAIAKKPGGAPGMARANVPVIPLTPAKGEIHGKPFVVQGSSIENGVLTLRMGQDVAADLEVQVVLPTPPWEVPAGKKFNVSNTSGANPPEVVVAWKETDQSAPSEQKFSDKYTLVLELGKEQDQKLSGKIFLSVPDETKSHVAGTFDADIKGFRLVDGKPDLTADSVDTLEYLAFAELLKKDQDNNLDVVAVRDGRYTQPDAPGQNMSGSIETEYRFGQGPTMVKRFQFEKDSNGWKVVRVLNGNQLDEAHPLLVPGPQADAAKVLTFLAAKKLEADIQKKSPQQNIYQPEFTSRYSDKFKIGVCEVSYKQDPAGELVTTDFLFHLRSGRWVLDRALRKNEIVNFDTGRLAKR